MDRRRWRCTAPSSGVLVRFVVIALTAFLTVVDLFATQAILPSLTRAYGVSPAAMGFAVNASTIGMAVAGLCGRAVQPADRSPARHPGQPCRRSSIPTALLAIAPDLTTFTLLRVAQGLCMASAFTLTLAYLGEQCSAIDAAGAFAAYITGNVASNLIGRLISAGVADHFGLASNFYFFAIAQSGRRRAGLLHRRTAAPMAHDWSASRSPLAAWLVHLRNPRLRAAFGIGFCILFAFIGTFTYVNFVLVRPPLSLGPMELGFVYFVFLPSIVTTPLAGRVVSRFGTRPTLWALAGARRRRPAAAAAAEPGGGPGRNRPRRRRHVLRAGDGDRLRRAAPRPPIADRRAASISPAISSAAWSAAPSSVRSSTGSAGRPASPASRSRS